MGLLVVVVVDDDDDVFDAERYLCYFGMMTLNDPSDISDISSD